MYPIDKHFFDVTDCAVILINYNSAVNTLGCLVALSKLNAPPAHIIVVDNGSHTEDLGALCESWQNLREPLLKTTIASVHTEILPVHVLLPLTENTGFSGGNNAALRLLLAHTKCKAFWLLNNDTIPSPDALEALCARLNQKPKAGLCGSTLVFADGSDKTQCAGGASLSPCLGTTKFIAAQQGVTTIACMLPEKIEKQLGEITGASMLVRREVFEKIGFMDERYFLYREDSEFSVRARRAGFDLAWAPQSIVYHKEGGSSGAKSDRSQQALERSRFVDYLSLRNRVFLMRTYYPWALPIVALSYVGVAINRLRRGQADRIILVCKAFWHGLCGKMGKPRADIYPSNTP